MKQLLLATLLILSFNINAQNIEGYHYQTKGGIANINSAFQIHKDTFCILDKIYSVSSNSYNCIAYTDANTGANYGYYVLDKTVPYQTTSTVSPFPSTGTKLVMKNHQEGVIFSPFAQFYYTTTNGFTTMTNNSVSILPDGATKFGYYSVVKAIPNYFVMFSSDGLTWNTVLSSNTTSFSVAKGKDKLYATNGNTVFVSNNGGNTFSTLSTTVNLTGAKLYAANDDTLYVVGTNKLIKSVDAGNTWLTATPASTVTFRSAAFKNGKEILLLHGTSNTVKYTYYSSDAASNFSLTNSAPPISYTAGLVASSKYFYSENNLLRTPDGINNGSVNQWDNYVPKISEKGYDLSFIGSTGLIGFATGSVAVSSNKGIYVNKVQKPSTVDAMAVKAVSSNLYFIGNRQGEVFKSTDAGTTWTKKYANSLNVYGIKFLVSQNTNTVAFHRWGQPIISVDGGETFNLSSQSIAGTINAMAMKPTSGQILFVQGSTSSGTFSMECSSIDLSTKTSLSNISITTNDNITPVDMEMVNDNTGYIIANNTTAHSTLIFKTTNGCSSFSQIATIPNSIANRNLQIQGTDTLYVLGKDVNNKSDFYHYSVDGGINWTKVMLDFSKPGYASQNENNAYKIHFFSPNQYMALVNGNSVGFPADDASDIYLKLTNTSNSSPTAINDGINSIHFNNIVLYPNPAREIINVKCEILNEPASITITNIMGQVVLSNTISSQESELNIQSLQSGIYFVTLVQKEKTSTVKFIKE